MNQKSGRLLIILFSNTLDFTKDGTVTLKAYDLSIRSDYNENHDTQESIDIEAKDTGSGINEEIMSHLLEWFLGDLIVVLNWDCIFLSLWICIEVSLWDQNNRGAQVRHISV